MKLIKIINGSIHLEHYMHNNEENMSIGLYALSLANPGNLIKIENDCQITINTNVIDIKSGFYTIEKINKLINPLVISYFDEKIKIESPCYYNLDEKLKKYLGIKDIYFAMTGDKIIYYPIDGEYYIHIEKECEFRLGRNGQIPLGTISIGIYSIGEIENVFNSFGTIFVANFPKIKFEIINGFLNVTASIGLCFDEYLSNCLGFDYIGDFKKQMIPINKTWPKGKEVENGIVYTPTDISYKLIGTNKPIFYTQGFLKNINGVIETKNSKIIIGKKNYTIDQLNKILPSNIKIQQTDKQITIISSIYCLLDENLISSLGLGKNYIHKAIGSAIIFSNFFENNLIEVHCNITENSISNHKTKQYQHIDDDILGVIKCDKGGQYITNDVKYIPINRIKFKYIEVFITDQDGIKIICDNFVAYLILTWSNNPTVS